MTLSYDETMRALMRQYGLPRTRAEAIARAQCAESRPAPAPVVEKSHSWPVRLRIPWSQLVPDNAKYGVIEGRLILKPRYRQAKVAIAKRAREQLEDRVPVAIPLRLVAAVYVPDRRPHDVCNFSKLVHDALEGVVYQTDRWLYDARWYRAGVDVDAPRVEITITPLTEDTP